MAAGRIKMSSMTDEEKLDFYDKAIQKHKDEIKKLKEKQKAIQTKIKVKNITAINDAFAKSSKSVEDVLKYINE